MTDDDKLHEEDRALRRATPRPKPGRPRERLSKRVDTLTPGPDGAQMILEASLCRAIDAGKATQIRTIVVASEPRYRRRKDRHGKAKRGQSMELVKATIPKRGDRFPIKAAQDKPVMCRVVVTTKPTVEQHGPISFADVRASGYKTTVEYKAAWVRRHDREWVDAMAERRAGDGDVTDVELAERFDVRWADGDVYVLHIEVDRTGERYLAADPAAMETDYVHSPARAMAGEPAAVDDQTLAQFTKDAREKPIITQMEVWKEERVELEQAIARAEQRVSESGDVGTSFRSSVRQLRRQLDVIERKIARAA